MNSSKIVMERLNNQQLINSKFTKPVELLSWLGAIQGQDFPGAKWAMGLRLPGIKDVDMEQSITDKTIVRTWLMRGTLHLVLANDVQWMIELLAPRIIKNNTRRYKDLKLDNETLKQSNKIIKDALADGGELNRRELLFILHENGISIEGQRGYFILQRASLEGLICQCQVNHNNATFISMDELPKSTLERDDAIAELARRYFQSRGPATITDFMWWSGLLATDAKTGIKAIKSDLSTEKLGKKEYWFFETETTDYTISQRAHLLPMYDEYFFGYKDRSASLEKIYKNKIRLKKHYKPIIVINGQIIGTWKRTFKENSVKIEYNPFITLKKSDNNALAEAEQHYREFLNQPQIDS